MSAPRAGAKAGLAAGAGVVGWVLHDLAVYLTSGEPALALGLLPRALVLVAAAAACGAALERGLRRAPRWLGPGLLIAAAAPVLFYVLPGPEARSQLVRAVWLLAVVAGVAQAVAPRLPAGELRVGLAGGALASVALAWSRIDLGAPALVVAGAAAACLALGLVPRPALRHVLTGLALLAAAGLVLREAVSTSRLSRADLEPVAGEPGAGPSLLLVVLDTVRADRLAPYGYARQTTPELDAFAAARAERHERAWSTSSWTLPAHGSLFTGLFPSEHGATHPRGGRDDATVQTRAAPAQRLRGDVPTLASLLRERGWSTAAVLGNFAFLDPRFGLDRGYQHYDARPGGDVNGHLPLSQMAGQQVRAGRLLYRDARTITDLALRWLERAPRDRPFFLTVNYMDAHAPYVPPPPYDRAFGAPRVAEPLLLRHADRALLYDRELLYLDSQLGRLLRAVGDDTLVIVTADHGEALGGHGYWMHDWALYEELVRVPLYVAPPASAGRPRSPVRDEPTTGADVFHLALAELGLAEEWRPTADPTLAEWYQVLEVPQAAVLADKHVERDLVAWLAGSTKVIVASTGEVEAYELGADPGELAPVALDDAAVEAARERARAWWAARPPPPPERVVLDPEEVERMRELGYMGGDS